MGIYWTFSLRSKANGEVVKRIDSCRENTSFFAEVPAYQGTYKDIEENRYFLIVFDSVLDGVEFKKKTQYGDKTIESTYRLVYKDPKLLIAPCDKKSETTNTKSSKQKRKQPITET